VALSKETRKDVFEFLSTYEPTRDCAKPWDEFDLLCSLVENAKLVEDVLKSIDEKDRVGRAPTWADRDAHVKMQWDAGISAVNIAAEFRISLPLVYHIVKKTAA
jgi:hypothetical protein